MSSERNAETATGTEAPAPRRGFSVAASPLNAVKLDLGIILVVGALLLLVHGKLVSGTLAQFLVLAVYGIGAMLWLIIRTRRVLHAVRHPQ
jgi:predicted membrane channel-forming protein YqfA (hemolysin III family)